MHSWPQVFTGDAHILCSEDRQEHSLGENEFWSRRVPHGEVKVLGKTHHDVVGTNGLAAELQRMVDESLRARVAQAAE